MKPMRVFAVLIGLFHVAKCASAKGFLDKVFKPGPPFSASITVDLDHPGRPVNRLVLGNNLQWVDNGDELLQASSVEFEPGMLDLATTLRPTVLRYPGGSQSDTYHCRHRLGVRVARRQHECCPLLHKLRPAGRT